MKKIGLEAAHGGVDWSPRNESLRQEIGKIWEVCGIENEWSPLRAVVMHRPGSEIERITDADKVLMLDVPNAALARRQHDNLVAAYRNTGVTVFLVDPVDTPPPNQMFVADLFFMTPEGAILARPASTVRAGEERLVAQRLAALGIPILRCVRGNGVFEGADASWVNPDTVIIGLGLRTNSEGAAQVASILHEMNVNVMKVDLPYAAMHLMGTMRFVDRDLAICWRTRVPYAAVETLRDHGYKVTFIPNEQEAVDGMALNFVTLGPKRILMPSGNPDTQRFYKDLGIEIVTVDVSELHKAAGGIGCLTGILARK